MAGVIVRKPLRPGGVAVIIIMRDVWRRNVAGFVVRLEIVFFLDEMSDLVSC